MKFYCFFHERVANLELFGVLCSQLPTFFCSGITSCMVWVTVNPQNLIMNKNSRNCCFTCEKTRLAFSFASPRCFDFIICEIETSKCFKCERKMFTRLYNVQMLLFLKKLFFRVKKVNWKSSAFWFVLGWLLYHLQLCSI